MFVSIALITAGFVIVMILVSLRSVRKEQQKEENIWHMEHIDGDVDSVYRAKDSEEAYINLSVLKSDVDLFESRIGQPARDLYDIDIREAKEYADDLARDEWETKAAKLLDGFIEKYRMVVAGEFRDADKLSSAKKRCLDLWLRYMQSPDDCAAVVCPKTFIREYLGECFDPCMLSSDALRKKLDDSITEHRSETDRKRKLIRQLMRTVEQAESVKRYDLLSASYGSCTPEEVRCCYKELLKNNRLAEIKYGRVCFVILSDKEKARRDKALAARETEKTASP